MKKVWLIALCFCAVKCCAAQTDTLIFFTNFKDEMVQREKAIYASIVTKVPANTLYDISTVYVSDLKLFSKGRTSDSAGRVKEGKFEYYYPEGTMREEGYFVHNLKEGEWNLYGEKGEQTGIYHFSKGKKTGKNMTWYESGSVMDSSSLNTTGTGSGIGFYESKNIRFEGMFESGEQNGKWIFYYDLPVKTKSMEIVYLKDSVMSAVCFKEDGSEMKDNCIVEREASFKTGKAGWIKYLTTGISSSPFARYMKDIYRYKVMVRFTINRKGFVTDVKVEKPNIRELDEIAVKIIAESPKWLPAIQFNQPVKAYRRQPVTFAMVE